MINNNKILTVSYGTFSCTLEGFEDSFGTMKAIAEYFRDLAADDRYFGAEPPQPDAEMLARIAQKEVARRVEAREQDGTIVLSALEDGSADAAPVAEDVVAEGDVADDAVSKDVVAEETPAAETPEAEADSPDVAAEAEAPAPVEAAVTDSDADVAAADVAVEEAVETPAPAAVAKPAKAAAIASFAPAVVSALAHDKADATEEPAVVDLSEAAVADVTPAPDAIDEAIEISLSPEAPAADDAVAEDITDKDITPAETVVDHADVEEITAQEVTEKEAAPQADDSDVPAAEQAPTAADIAAIQAAVAANPAKAAPIAEDVNDIVPGQPDAEVEAFFAGKTAEDDIEEAVAEDAPEAPESQAGANDIAAKLQRIRAVVARHEETDEEDDYLEDEHAETKASPAVERSAALIEEVREEAENALSIDDAADAADAAEAAADDADDVASILSRLESEVPVAEATAAPAPQETPAAQAQAVTEDENLFEGDSTDESPADAPVQVLKVKRADLEAAIDESDLEEVAEDAAEAVEDKPLGLDDLAPAKSDKTTLSPEDQADLARELAELEADIKSEQADADDTASDAVETLAAQTADVTKDAADDDAALDAIAASIEAEPTPADETPEPATAGDSDDAATGRGRLPSLDADNVDVNRLLAETDQQLDEPESADRRKAFEHLRAAVAAKKADATIDAEEALRKSDNAYRDDLAEVVRPRRPKAKEGRTSRPDESRPAPLKLVAEQRIDVEQPKASGPVRPRRVAAMADMQSEGDGESFVQFAEEVGATTLPQLLEAAAAYLSFVEGREQFSRPQLMTKVRQAGGDEGFSREEGLRSFGQLLRTGKIEKIKGGRFTVSDDIGFRPDERAAG